MEISIDGGYQSKRRSQQTMEEEVAYYEKDFDEYVETWDEFRDVVKGDSDRWNSYRELYANDLLLRKDDKFYWHARGITAGHIIKAMYKHEIEDIYEKLPSNILLLRATLPEKLDEHRNMTCGKFQQKTGAKVKLVPNTTHLLHWDNPDKWLKKSRKMGQFLLKRGLFFKKENGLFVEIVGYLKNIFFSRERNILAITVILWNYV
jgi:hypothetical protein